MKSIMIDRKVAFAISLTCLVISSGILGGMIVKEIKTPDEPQAQDFNKLAEYYQTLTPEQRDSLVTELRKEVSK